MLLEEFPHHHSGPTVPPPVCTSRILDTFEIGLQYFPWEQERFCYRSPFFRHQHLGITPCLYEKDGILVEHGQYNEPGLLGCLAIRQPVAVKTHPGSHAVASLGPFPALDQRLVSYAVLDPGVSASNWTLSQATLSALSKGEVVSSRRDQVFHLLCRGEGRVWQPWLYSDNFRSYQISLCDSTVLYFLFAEYRSHLSTAVHWALWFGLSPTYHMLRN